MDIIKIRRELHKIPESGFQELKTQQYLLDQIRSLPQEKLEIIEWKTGIVVKIRGLDATKLIAWRTDIDGLPIEEKTGLAFSSLHEHYMHACGHDIHMANAVGLLEQLIKTPIKQDVLILFQPAEEGPGGALLLREWLKNERPDLWPDEIFAMHIAPELPVGTVSTKPGLLFANTSELFIDLHGKGGHAAFPHLTVDMAMVGASLLMQLQTIVSRNIDPVDSAVLTIGKFSAGTVQNIIAENALLEGTIRTLNGTSMVKMKKRIEAVCKGIEIGYNCRVTIDYGATYKEVENDAKLVKYFLDFAELAKGISTARADAAMTGEDFGFFTDQIPGMMFWAGVNSEYGLHHSKMNPDEKILEIMPNFIYHFFNEL